jgi:hypothetical protein
VSITEGRPAAKTPRAKKRRLTPPGAVADPAKYSRTTTQPRSRTSSQLDKSAAASNIKASKPGQSARAACATKTDSQPNTPNGKGERPRNKGGRPTSYTEAIGAEILERLSGGESLSEICQSRTCRRDRLSLRGCMGRRMSTRGLGTATRAQGSCCSTSTATRLSESLRIQPTIS